MPEPSNPSPLIEVCCGSAEDVFCAKAGGASRVELNSGLFFGGLTPSVGAVRTASEAGIAVMAMVRPREGGFCYSDIEFKTALSDARLLLENGADGIVFGFLQRDGSLDYARCREMMAVIGPRVSVFHRAIDLVGERWKETIDMLCSLHVTRILTSGQRATAVQGRETIRAMREYAAGRIEILPGGGVRAGNVRELLRFTGCTQAHTSGSQILYDDTALLNGEVQFTAAQPPQQNAYKKVDANLIADVVAAAKGPQPS